MASLPDHLGFDSTGTIRNCLLGEKWGVGKQLMPGTKKGELALPLSTALKGTQYLLVPPLPLVRMGGS